MKRRIFARLFVVCFAATILVGSIATLRFEFIRAVDANLGGEVPIKWALIVLGGFNYYATINSAGIDPIQKVSNWLYSKGVPYDIIPDDNLTSPSDAPGANKFSLQYANSIIKYQVLVVIPNSHSETGASNANLIYSAVGNGSNVAMFDMAPKLLPSLMGFSSSEVSRVFNTSLPYGLNVTVANPFSDGNLFYAENQQFTVGSNAYYGQTRLQNAAGKTVWYNWTYVNGFTWGIGMMNGTYGSGKVWWNSVVLDRADLLNGGGGGYQGQWYTNNFGFIAHAINFMFDQCTKINFGIQGYHEYKGGVIIRLDQDTTSGLAAPVNETALQNGWVYDLDACALGYGTYIETTSTLTDGMPAGYIGSPGPTVKYGTARMVFGAPNGATSWQNDTTETFIIYNTTAYSGRWLTVKIDFNNNKDFSDDIAYNVWENITYSGMLGKYYLCYVDNETNPTSCQFGWWGLLSEVIPSSWLTTYQYYGRTYNLTYGLHTYQHMSIGNSSFYSHTYMWDENSKNFVANQTWTELMFTLANNELIKCFGSTGAGVEANECIVSQGGNEENTNTINAMGNSSFILFYYMYGEPGFYTPQTGRPAVISSAADKIDCSGIQFYNLASEMTNTLYSVMSVYTHNTGSYNLSFTFTPYSSSFKPANARDLYHFWENARYMLEHTTTAYWKDDRIVLEYKANSTLKDYVWRFPVEFDGKYFNGFSDNRTVGKIKHIDGKYIYIEFSEGGNERLEATYGTKPHIHQTSSYIENITQIYTSKNLTLQLWNASGSINVKVNCAAFGQPNATKINGNLIDFEYDSITRICSFNVTLNGLSTVELLWTYAPPDPPTFLSPSAAKRFDPNKSVTFSWEFNDPDLDDFQSAYRFQLDDDSSFFSPLIDAGKVSSSSTQTTQTLPNSIGLYYWRIKTWDNRNAEGDWSDPQTIIVDRLKVASKGVTHDRTDVGSPVYVYFNVIREYDNTPFDRTKGTVYINESAATWDETNRYWKLSVTQNSVGRWEYKVSSITDTEHQITTVNDFMGTQEVIWDKLIVTIAPEATTVTVGTQVKFTVTAVYAYDNESVPEFTTNILRDGKHFAVNNFTNTCNIEFAHLYTTENITEKTYGLTAFTSNSATVTWTPKPLIQQLMDWMTSNALILVPIIQLAIILTYLLIRERRKNKKVQQSCH